MLAKALDHLEPGAPGLAAVDFDRAGDQHLADPAAAGGHDDRVVLGAERDDRLVGLDQAAERLALRVDHGAAQLGAQHPGGSVRAEAELALQLQRRDAVGVRRHQKRRPEPNRQRQLAGMHDRAGGHRGLPTAIGAFIGEGFGLQQPSTALAATGQTNPSGQRRSKRYAAHALSVAKRPWNSINDFGNRPSDPDTTSPCSSDTDEQLTPPVPVLYTKSGSPGRSCISPFSCTLWCTGNHHVT